MGFSCLVRVQQQRLIHVSHSPKTVHLHKAYITSSKPCCRCDNHVWLLLCRCMVLPQNYLAMIAIVKCNYLPEQLQDLDDKMIWRGGVQFLNQRWYDFIYFPTNDSAILRIILESFLIKSELYHQGSKGLGAVFTRWAPTSCKSGYYSYKQCKQRLSHQFHSYFRPSIGAP